MRRKQIWLQVSMKGKIIAQQPWYITFHFFLDKPHFLTLCGRLDFKTQGSTPPSEEYKRLKGFLSFDSSAVIRETFKTFLFLNA